MPTSSHSIASLPRRHRSWWRRGVVFTSALAVGLSGALLPGLTATPPPAAAAEPDITIVAPTGEVESEFIGKTGNVVLASIDSVQKMTADGGATWQDAPTQKSIRVVTAGYAYTTDTTIKAHPVAGGTPLELTAADGWIQAAWRTYVAVAENTGTRVIVDMATQARLAERDAGSVAGMGPSGAAWLTYDRTTSTDKLEIQKWDGSTISPILPDPSSPREVQVHGDEVQYLSVTAAGVQYCIVPLSTGAVSCLQVAEGDYRTAGSSRLASSDEAILVRLGESKDVRLIEDGHVTPVRMPATGGVPVLRNSDTGRPVLTLAQVPFSVAADGSLQRTATYPQGQLTQAVVGLTPGRVVTLDRRDDAAAATGIAWTRSVGATVAGKASPLPKRATQQGDRASSGTSYVSGLRTVLFGRARMEASVTDRDQVTADSLPLRQAYLSGPYLFEPPRLFEDGKVFTADGANTGATGHAIFGSRVASLHGTTVTVTDIARPAAQALTFTVGGDSSYLPGVWNTDAPWIAGMYGDWIVVVTSERDPAGNKWDRLHTVTAHNLVTGQEMVRPVKHSAYEATVRYVGDGHAWVEDGLWTFADNTVTPMGLPVASDGVNRVAYMDGKNVVIRTLAGLGTSAARVLGVLAPDSLDLSEDDALWTPEIDSTKGITAGKIEIRDAANAVVRQIDTPASETGGLRDVGWDGRNASGDQVPDGEYSWTLIANSADGTGPVKAVDGVSPATGSLRVTGSSGSPGTGTGSDRFSDVYPGIEHYEHIIWLADKGVTTGYDDGTFRPTQPVNRDAMAAFMYRLAGSPKFDPAGKQSFVDVTPTTQFYKEIEWLAATGISTGWDGCDGKEFRPVQPVARDAMAAFLYRLYGSPEFKAPGESPFVDVPVGTQFYTEMAWLADTGISTGWVLASGAEFRPLQPVNRDAMAAFMNRAYDKFGQPTP